MAEQPARAELVEDVHTHPRLHHVVRVRNAAGKTATTALQLVKPPTAWATPRFADRDKTKIASGTSTAIHKFHLNLGQTDIASGSAKT